MIDRHLIHQHFQTIHELPPELWRACVSAIGGATPLLRRQELNAARAWLDQVNSVVGKIMDVEIPALQWQGDLARKRWEHDAREQLKGSQADCEGLFELASKGVETLPLPPRTRTVHELRAQWATDAKPHDQVLQTLQHLCDLAGACHTGEPEWLTYLDAHNRALLEMEYVRARIDRAAEKLWSLDDDLRRQQEAAPQNPPAAAGNKPNEPADTTLVDPPVACKTWREAAERMKRLQAQGEQFESQEKMAKRFGCSKTTIQKAIQKTRELQTWGKQPDAAPRAVGQARTEEAERVLADSPPRSPELDPEDEVAIREFIEQAKPDEKAWFLSLSVEAQLEYLNDPFPNDPDRHQKAFPRP
jgi:hypothetical protein